MAIIRPFRALRPKVALVDQVAALPYDVMNVAEARAMASGNPYSFLHISRPEIDLTVEVDPYAEEVYLQGQRNLQQFCAVGTLVQETTACMYIYRQRMGELEQTGLVVCSSVDDYQSGVIKKHEMTRADKEEDRVKHIDYLDANDEPVFYTYRQQAEIAALMTATVVKQPVYDFVTADGVSHALWTVDEPAMIARLVELFAAIPALYVADGHHRSAAASRVRDRRQEQNPGHTGDEEYNYFLTVIFPDREMHIMPYNRVVKDLNGLTVAEFMTRITASFDVTPMSAAVAPHERHRFGMYLAGCWYELQARDEIYNEEDPVDSLDVSILQNNLLSPVLGIRNPRTDQRINFVGGIRGVAELERLVDGKDYAVAFSLNPTSMTELMALADADKIMPPKSTWFEPKLRSGLFVHLLS